MNDNKDFNNIFLSNLDKSILDSKKNLNIDISKYLVLKQIESFRTEYFKLLSPMVWDDAKLSLRVDELDFILMFYNDLYNRVTEALENNKLEIWPNDSRCYNIMSVYLIRFIIQDIFSLRNLCVIKFENQFNAILRNFLEKIDVFFLFMYDYEFSNATLFNDEKKSDKKLYYDLLSRKKIRERIKNNLDKILIEENEQGKSFLRADKHIYNFLENNTVEDLVYPLLSNFTHSNNLNNILKYYLEKNKFNYTLLHNESDHFEKTLDYSIEFSLIILAMFETAFKRVGVGECVEVFKYLDLGYQSILIERIYKTSK